LSRGSNLVTGASAYGAAVGDDWDVSDDEMDEWAAEWRQVDLSAAAYLAKRCPEILEPLTVDDQRWLDEVIDTFSPTDDSGIDHELVSSVMALQHADWLALALGSVRRGVGSRLDAEVLAT